MRSGAWDLTPRPPGTGRGGAVITLITQSLAALFLPVVPVTVTIGPPAWIINHRGGWLARHRSAVTTLASCPSFCSAHSL